MSPDLYPARRALLLALALSPMGPLAGTGAPAEVQAELAQARLQGSGRLNFFGMRIYESRLWVGPGFAADQFERSPLALELIYARALEGRQIAERALVEMRKLGPVGQAEGSWWLAEMVEAFPDVDKGDRLTGLYRPDESARFHLNGKLLREIRDAEFARSFFGIWLSARSSEPALRQALLGAARGGP